ncbi:MAG: DUF438 domain-containing protein [Candidatus Hodarchaeota archaeon]
MSQKVLNESTKISELLKEFPTLLESLIKYDQKLKKLGNPILRKTVGRTATVLDISNTIGISAEKLIAFLSDEIKRTSSLVEVKKGMNLDIDRKKALKQLILDLHEGKKLEELKKRFNELLGDVGSSEIAMIEQQLIDEGDLSVEEITKLCDLHVGIFEDALNVQQGLETVPGHPVHTYIEENRIAKILIRKMRKYASVKDLEELSKIIIHYTRLENQLFPVLEQKGFSGPSKVMWAKHDEIRELFKSSDSKKIESLLNSVEDMITKEEKILFPTALEKLNVTDWMRVRDGEEEIGYAWVENINPWKPITPAEIHKIDTKGSLDENLNLDTGILTLNQVNLLLKHLPIDISFVNENDTLLYYSNVKDRIFPRSPGVIGRKVQNCHPPKSIHIVNQILNAFKEGSKDSAEFWIQSNGKFIRICYFAVRNELGEYCGTLEVSQDITEIKKLKGEQRLLSWGTEN